MKKLLPKLLYAMGGVGMLLGLLRLAAGIADGYLDFGASGALNYVTGILSTFGTALLYMAAARVVELLEGRYADQP